MADDMRFNIDRELVRSRLAPSVVMRQSDADMTLLVSNIIQTLQKVSGFESIAMVSDSTDTLADRYSLKMTIQNMQANVLSISLIFAYTCYGNVHSIG
ncbi:MAG: hypothetical protein AB8B64_06525 [Granulosicoccus sp.]